MTSLALRLAPRPASFLSVLLERHRGLTLYGLLLLGFAALTLALQLVDARTLESGVNVWVKPTKFFVSVAIFALTTAWYFGHVRPERRGSPAMRATAATLIFAGTFELAWISWQAAHGLESHFNNDTPFFTLMYGLMGLFALILTATTLPLAREIARRPAEGLTRDYRAALVIGLVLTFLLGAGLGAAMSGQSGHSVGAEGGAVPLFGWNRSGGDLRIAHFLGIHAHQAIPLLGLAVSGFETRQRWRAVIGGSLLFAAVTLGLFVQAMAGRPLLPA